MAIVDENDQQVSQPVVDENAIVQRVLDGLRASGQQPTQQTFDSVAAATHKLKSEGYDPAFIEGQVMAMQALRYESDQKLNHVANQVYNRLTSEMNGRNVESRALDVIQRNLSKRYKDNPALKDMDPAIRARITDKWNNNKTLATNYNNGRLDDMALDEICDNAADYFEDKLGGGSSKLSAPSLGGSSGAAAKNVPQNKDPKVEITEHDLENEHQIEFYYAMQTARERYLGEDTKTAKAKALETASRLQPPPLRKAVL